MSSFRTINESEPQRVSSLQEGQSPNSQLGRLVQEHESQRPQQRQQIETLIPGVNTFRTPDRFRVGGLLPVEQVVEDHQIENSQKEKEDDVRRPYMVIVQTNELEEKITTYYLNQNLTIIKSECLERTDYKIITEFYRDPKSLEILIGRTRPLKKNHIFITNELVSRNHCKLTLVENESYPLSRRFLTFLKCRKQAEPYQALSHLPNTAIKLIFQFAKHSHGYYLSDESRNGTFIQVKNWHQLKQGEVYCLAGQRYEMKILNIIYNLSNSDRVDQVYNQRVSDMLNFQSKYKNKFIPQETASLDRESAIAKKLSYLQIEIIIDKTPTTYILTSKKKLITMGLNADIDLSDPTVPYNDKQAQIRFEKGKWQLKDGGISPSTYGSWRKLVQKQTYKLGQQQTVKLGSVVTLQITRPTI